MKIGKTVREYEEKELDIPRPQEAPVTTPVPQEAPVKVGNPA